MKKEHWHMVKAGGSQIVNSPEALWEAAQEYFKFCDDNPIKTKRTIQSGKSTGEKVEVEHTRLYNIKAFCIHAGISERYLKDITQSHANDSVYFQVVERILYIIYSQNVEGASADIFNPIIVSKMLQLEKAPDDKEPNVKIEIVSSISNKLANSEDEILKNLDLEKLSLVKDKSENLQRENMQRESHIQDINDENDKPGLGSGSR